MFNNYNVTNKDMKIFYFMFALVIARMRPSIDNVKPILLLFGVPHITMTRDFGVLSSHPQSITYINSKNCFLL
jgi:hypothetical protein